MKLKSRFTNINILSSWNVLIKPFYNISVFVLYRLAVTHNITRVKALSTAERHFYSEVSVSWEIKVFFSALSLLSTELHKKQERILFSRETVSE